MNLQEWRESGLQLIQALRVRGEEGAFRRLLSDIYPEKAHFIYELFQNAEDANAFVCRFTLSKSGLEFEHNGIRLFTEDDVKSITSFGNSTKRDDPTSIGKFGVGFKAVFAYTNTPEIHSGEFHFRIRDLVVLETDGVPRIAMSNRETRFVFPFNNPDKPHKEAAEEVERSLRALSDNTLLFLSHIRKIEYLLPDGNLGTLERVEKENGRIEIHASQPGAGTTVSYWLRFMKDVEATDENGKPKTCRIAVAYSLTEEEQKKGNTIWRIVPLDHGQVSIYFPAVNAASNLRFHLHAPFASTVARDSIRDCEANQSLRDYLADLVVESLTAIRDLGMLTVSFFAVLPNPQDNLSDFYEPIREAIVKAFMNGALTPTRSGSHAPASALYRGPARIQEVLDDDDLSLLTQFDVPLWAKNPPQENQREARLLDSLAIDRFEWAELIEILPMHYWYHYEPEEEQTEIFERVHRIETWMEGKEDAWVMRFYALLGEACDIHEECMHAEGFRVVRVESGQGHEHVTPQDAFFPPEQETTLSQGILFVKPTVLGRSESQKKLSASFLEKIGVRHFDAKTIVELKLGHYKKPPDLVDNVHYKDLLQFMAYWKKNPGDAEIFRKHNFLLGESESKALYWCTCAELCVDTPYLNTGLAELSSIHGKYTLCVEYKDKFNERQFTDFLDFLKAIGVMYELRVSKARIYSNPNMSDLWKGLGNTRVTNTAIEDDYSIDSLDSYTKLHSISASRLIWQALLKANKRVAKAWFTPNQKYEVRTVESQLIQHLKNCAWLPDKSGTFHKPQDMTIDGLQTDFPHDDQNGLLTAIGFGENSRKRSDEYQSRNRDAQRMGFTSVDEAEEFAKLKNEGLTLADLKSWLARRNKTEQPKDSVRDRDRRQEKVLANAAEAPSKESVLRERSVQKGLSELTAQAKAYLRAKYKNSEGQLVCQCCKSEMPFKLPRTEEYYFEAVQCINDKDTRHYQSRLALCPTCAAMYQYARETDDTELLQRIVGHTADDQADAVEILVRLAGHNHALRFVGTHWFDLKTVLQVVKV